VLVWCLWRWCHHVSSLACIQLCNIAKHWG
jgi:hypothetical protein